MPLKTKQGFPPGGYIFFQPETGWSAPNPMSDNFDQTVERISEHRSKNPRFNLALDYDLIAEELDLFTCKRLKFDPYWCTTSQKKTKAQVQAVQSQKRSLAALVRKTKQTVQGAEILSEWIGEGSRPVAQELADTRSLVCLKCPKNNMDPSLTATLGEGIKKTIELRNSLGLKSKQESNIGTCDACGCYLPLKVWVPPRHLSDTNDAEFPDYCWNATESHKEILVVIPFYKGDYNQAKDLLEWINDLGEVKNNSCLLLADIKMPIADINVLRDIAQKCFKDVAVTTTPHSLPNEKWPIGPNWMFQTACEYVYKNTANPFLWLEPDALPLKRGWLAEMEDEYNCCGKPFMGAVVHSSGQDGLPGDHLTGVAIYPNNAHEYLKVNYNKREAFDMTSAPIVIPHTHHTDLHYHFWGKKDLSPVFKADRSPDNPKNTLLLKTIPEEAVIFHRCKNDSLLKLLRLTTDLK